MKLSFYLGGKAIQKVRMDYLHHTGLDVRETKDLISSISDIGNFDGVFIISNNGETLLASKSR